MVESTAESKLEEKRRPLSGLLFWLVLLPVIVGMLVFCSQLASLFDPEYSAVDTRSRMSANYLPWPYDLIPAFNLPALIEDIARDERAMGNTVQPTVVVQATFLAPPTPTPTDEAPAAQTPVVFPTLTSTPEPPASATPAPTIAQPTPSRTATFAATTTPSPSASPTRTATRPIILPTSTNTEPPPPPPTPTFTNTPRPTATFTHTPRPTATLTHTLKPPATFTHTPTATITNTPTSTPTTETPPPEYLPIIPMVETLPDGSTSEPIEGGGCRAYFSYWNQNTYAVDIQLGARNHISEDISPDPQPTHFDVGPPTYAFTVEWYSGFDFIWTLDGISATAAWCNP